MKRMYHWYFKLFNNAMVIGNNHFKVGDEHIEVPNDRVIPELSLKVGFTVDRFISRELHKSSEGNIREESVVILEKPGWEGV